MRLIATNEQLYSLALCCDQRYSDYKQKNVNSDANIFIIKMTFSRENHFSLVWFE